MQRIKAFLVVSIIVVLSTIYFLDMAMTAEVTRIHKNKGHIYINEGKSSGFVKGAAVCFFSPSGKELLCGKVLRTSGSYAVVKVNNREVRRIKIGTEAKLYVEEKKR